MASVKFHSNKAVFSERKNSNVSIDSRSTHHCFYFRASLMNHKANMEGSVQAANATSKNVGKWNVVRPLGIASMLKLIMLPIFLPNIISVGLLQKKFEIFFYESIRGYLGCFLKKSSMNIIAELKLNDSQYPLILSRPNPNSCHANAAKKDNPVDKWHGTIEYLSSTLMNKYRYELNSDIPTLDREKINQNHVVPCMVGNTRRFYDPTSPRKTTRPLELILVEILQLIEPLLEGYRCTVEFDDDFTAPSLGKTLKKRSELSQELFKFKHRAEFELQMYSIKLMNISLDCAGEIFAVLSKDYALRTVFILSLLLHTHPKGIFVPEDSSKDAVPVLVSYNYLLTCPSTCGPMQSITLNRYQIVSRIPLPTMKQLSGVGNTALEFTRNHSMNLVPQDLLSSATVKHQQERNYFPN